MVDMKQVLDGFPTEVSLVYGGRVLHEGVDESDHETPPKRVSVVFAFSEKGFGFGEITLVQTDEGVFMDTELMSLERVKRYLAMLLDTAITDVDNDPEKHALYNEVMGRICGEGCTLCYPSEQELV